MLASCGSRRSKYRMIDCTALPEPASCRKGRKSNKQLLHARIIRHKSFADMSKLGYNKYFMFHCSLCCVLCFYCVFKILFIFCWRLSAFNKKYIHSPTHIPICRSKKSVAMSYVRSSMRSSFSRTVPQLARDSCSQSIMIY